MTAIPSSRLVTVFGGSGFIGRHTVRALANAGWRIRVAVRDPHTAHFLLPMGRVGAIQIVKCNVRDETQVEAALHGAQAAINLVGTLAPAGAQNFRSLHIEAPGIIAQAAKKLGVARLVHVSTMSASMDAPARYFRSKAEGEARVQMAYPQATILRPSLVFGPEDNVFNRFAWLAKYFPVLPLFGGGHTRFQPVFVGDVAAAIVAVLEKPQSASVTYELAGPETMTFKNLLELILREIHRKRILMPLPFGLGILKGFFLGLLPNPLLTMDQVRMLRTDTVAHAGTPGFADLGIIPNAVEAVVPAYLWRFRKEGQFEAAVS